MNPLTNEERARIFAMYIPCDAEINGRHTRIVSVCFHNYQDDYKYEYEDVIVETDEVGYETGGRWATTDFKYFKEQVPKLKLSPLSKITDEQAIEISNMLFRHEIWNVSRKANEISVTSKNYIVSYESSVVCVTYLDGKYMHTTHTILSVYDRLRELEYALPYKGQSLFDLGIAIDKTTL